MPARISEVPFDVNPHAPDVHDPELVAAAMKLGLTPDFLALNGHRFFIVGEFIARQGDCAGCRQDVIGLDPWEARAVLEDEHAGCEVVAHGYNKIVGQGLRHIINAIVGQTSTTQVFGFTGVNNGATLAAMRVGTGTGATVDGTTTLVAQNATAPNTVSITTDTPATSTYRVKVTATWNAGTLTAITVTEIGLFGALWLTLGAVNNPGTATNMFSRLSSTDGEFSSFVVNIAVPLSIEYRCSIVFA